MKKLKVKRSRFKWHNLLFLFIAGFGIYKLGLYAVVIVPFIMPILLIFFVISLFIGIYVNFISKANYFL